MLTTPASPWMGSSMKAATFGFSRACNTAQFSSAVLQRGAAAQVVEATDLGQGADVVVGDVDKAWHLGPVVAIATWQQGTDWKEWRGKGNGREMALAWLAGTWMDRWRKKWRRCCPSVV